jgi:hypothetical protein
MGGVCGMHRIGGKIVQSFFLVGKSLGKKQLEKPRRRWENEIRLDLRVWGGFSWLRIGADGGLL